jgi:TM2 domain-containing membrane protein YozV
MPIKESRTKKFAYSIITLYFLNFIFGGIGSFCENESAFQTLSWHISTTSMIAACVLMGAYIAEKGWSFASGGFYLLGVANGVFFASLNIGDYSPMTLARGILVLIPAFIAIGMSNYFRPWLKCMSVSTAIPFIILYIRILSGKSHVHDAYEVVSFFYLNVMSIIWAVNIWWEMRREVEIKA